ncbi:SH3 domain-containing protein [Clostridium sporogenes]|nr:SH3 domain-containing protein [Clostridium sporogenes]
MINKKIVASLLMATCIFSAGGGLFGMAANADTLNNNVAETSNIETTINDDDIVISPRIAGMVTVTSKSGANIRKGAGTNFSKINPAARYGEELDYCGKTKKGTDGVNWYQVEWQGQYGWISSSVSSLG